MNSIFGSIDDLFLFCKVVQLGSQQGAAKELKLPVSTVSRRLSLMEEKLGVRLLEKRDESLLQQKQVSNITNCLKVSLPI